MLTWFVIHEALSPLNSVLGATLQSFILKPGVLNFKMINLNNLTFSHWDDEDVCNNAEKKKSAKTTNSFS